MSISLFKYLNLRIEGDSHTLIKNIPKIELSPLWAFFNCIKILKALAIHAS